MPGGPLNRPDSRSIGPKGPLDANQGTDVGPKATTLPAPGGIVPVAPVGSGNAPQRSPGKKTPSDALKVCGARR